MSAVRQRSPDSLVLDLGARRYIPVQHLQDSVQNRIQGRGDPFGTRIVVQRGNRPTDRIRIQHLFDDPRRDPNDPDVDFLCLPPAQTIHDTQNDTPNRAATKKRSLLFRPHDRINSRQESGQI